MKYTSDCAARETCFNLETRKTAQVRADTAPIKSTVGTAKTVILLPRCSPHQNRAPNRLHRATANAVLFYEPKNTIIVLKLAGKKIVKTIKIRLAPRIFPAWKVNPVRSQCTADRLHFRSRTEIRSYCNTESTSGKFYQKVFLHAQMPSLIITFNLKIKKLTRFPLMIWLIEFHRFRECFCRCYKIRMVIIITIATIKRYLTKIHTREHCIVLFYAHSF